MIQAKTYVRETEEGALRVGELDVSLDSVVIAYQQGQHQVATFLLAIVYGDSGASFSDQT